MAEKLTWIDKKSVLYSKGRIFKAGDSVPAGLITGERLNALVNSKKIVVGEIKVDKSIKQTKLYNADIEAKVIQHEEKNLIEDYKEDQPEIVEEEKPKRGRKSKAELEEEELQKMIEEEENNE